MEHDYIEFSKLIRAWCLKSTTNANSGHPTTCLSAADLMTVLFAKYFSYDIKDPVNVNNDRLIFSKGHAAPLLYTLYGLSGAFEPEKLLDLRKATSELEGHPTPEFKYSDASTGSLGQGLSIACGIAYFAKSKSLDYKTYVLIGDGELAEGQIWEACNFASYNRLDNLIVFADINRLGQSQQTMFGHDIDEYVSRFRSFGFEVIGIDGHDYKEIDAALKLAHSSKNNKPKVIVAKTYKGRGISFLEDKPDKHGKPLTKEELKKALFELGEIDYKLRFNLKKPGSKKISVKTSDKTFAADFKIGDEIATREIYGKTLAKYADINEDIYALDAEVKNSTFSIDFKNVHEDRFIECFIAEQNMVSVAVGLSRMQQRPFISTFSAFFTRAYDSIRMARIGGANLTFVGTHAGVSIGEDGSSQMGLEDISMFAAIPDSVILQPSDAVSTAKLISQLYKQKGISYLRLLRPKTKVKYQGSEEFRIGGLKLLRETEKDELVLVCSGITVDEGLKACENLAKHKISVSLIDCYSIKPLDGDSIINAAKKTKLKKVLVVEDHYSYGGLGDIISSSLADTSTGIKVYKQAVTKIPHSGTTAENLSSAGIDSAGIVNAVKNLI